jgi:hypothetical protein
MKIKSHWTLFIPTHCFLYFFVLIICLLVAFSPFILALFTSWITDPDPHSECRSGSRRLSNADPDPKNKKKVPLLSHCLWEVRFRTDLYSSQQKQKRTQNSGSCQVLIRFALPYPYFLIPPVFLFSCAFFLFSWSFFVFYCLPHFIIFALFNGFRRI